jgi:ribonucleoside-diphosphate reductase alpha chain
MESMNEFRTELGLNIFKNKYAQNQYETWADRAHIVVDAVAGTNGGTEKALMTKEERDQLVEYLVDFKWLPGGRYLWYAGRKARFYNNCYLLKAEEDSREEWADLWKRAGSCLMTGGGIGIDVTNFRPKGRTLSKTGGVSSGPIPFLLATNEIGRNVMQGGSRRSAMYGSMNWQHEDAQDFLRVKNWTPEQRAAKEADFNAPAPLDMMNVSLNYDDAWLKDKSNPVFLENVKQAMKTGEPGFSFNFGDKQNETLRNACCEVVSEDDSDVCNLSSVNMSRIESVEEFKDVVHLVTKFLVCGLERAELPYQKVYDVRQKNSRLGLGLMGMHEWLLKRGHKYEVTDELKQWLKVYRNESDHTSRDFCNELYRVIPKGVRAIAPTGTISILAGTTSGVEPVYSVAFKRRYLTDGTRWKHEFVVDGTAQVLIEMGINPNKIESAVDLAQDPERRIKFQHDVQAYVDQAISSTINLPAWDTEHNNADLIPQYVGWIQKYAKGLRGLTVYPDGARGGQPITSVPYEEAINKKGMIFEDNSEEQCLSGVCGI